MPVASVRITLIDRDVPSYFQSLEHLLRYCARPPFALERLSVTRSPDGGVAKVRYVLPRHKAANWVGSGRGRRSTRPGVSGVVELSPFDFSSGSRISCRLRASAGIGITECLHRITDSGGRSRRWRSATAASDPTPRPAGIGAPVTPQEAFATRLTRPKSPARMTGRGSPGRN